MLDQNGLMILRAAREHRGDEGDAEAAALIAEEVGEAGGFVVLFFRQVGVGELADRNEECCDAEALETACEGLDRKSVV